MMHVNGQKAGLLGGAAVLVAIVFGAIVQPSLVYDQFIWKYFWGPIVADAAGQATAVHNGVVAHSGYTLVNEIGYGLMLAYILLLLISVLKRFDVGTDRGFVIAFIPFIVGGGLLRVVEDASTAGLLSVRPPLQYLLISPIIYGTMFVGVFATLIIGIWAARRGHIPSERYAVAGVGSLFAIGTLSFLMIAVPVFNWWVAAASLGIAAVVLGAVYGVFQFIGLKRYISDFFSAENGSVLAGHLVDGSATAVTFELVNPAITGSGALFSFTSANTALLESGYGEKHPVVQFFINATGSAWFFVLLKLAVIGGILHYMTSLDRDDDPLFYNLVLLGILAVGLGPGTRSMMRAVFGV